MEKHASEIEGSIDRLSQLPKHILHHILCFVSQKQALQTCVLSKSWRYIGPTRPKLEFRKTSFPRNNETFPGCQFLDNILQRYCDQKLSIQEFRLSMSVADSESISFLEKWIPVIMMDMSVKEFDFSFASADVRTEVYIDLPLALFKSKSIQDLCLEGCKLNHCPTGTAMMFKHLTSLSLTKVYMEDETVDKILLSCYFLVELAFQSCEGFKSIKVSKAHSKLKLFEFCSQEDRDISIEIDVPIIRTIKIDSCPNWLNVNKYVFKHLTTLYLGIVQLSEKSLENFSSNFPCLIQVSLMYCYGFEELHLSSRSIKFLAIDHTEKFAKIVIDAPRLEEFEFEGGIPESLCFKSTASEWISQITLWCDVTLDAFSTLWWCHELFEMLKSLKASKISLDIFQEITAGNEQPVEADGPHIEELCRCGCAVDEPVGVERLCLRLTGHSVATISVFIDNLFYICRPRIIAQTSYLYPSDENEVEENQLIELLTDTFRWRQRAMRTSAKYFWLQCLGQVCVEKYRDDDDNRHDVVFTLKWLA